METLFNRRPYITSFFRAFRFAFLLVTGYVCHEGSALIAIRDVRTFSQPLFIKIVASIYSTE